MMHTQHDKYIVLSATEISVATSHSVTRVVYEKEGEKVNPKNISISRMSLEYFLTI